MPLVLGMFYTVKALHKSSLMIIMFCKITTLNNHILIFLNLSVLNELILT